MTTRRSFFERLSGAPTIDDPFDDELPTVSPSSMHADTRPGQRGNTNNSTPRSNAIFNDDQADNEGQLPVDVHQTPTDIVIRAFVAGVRADELNLSISHDMVEIEGTRAEREHIADQDYFTQELFWGSFSRTILLPQEVDVDASTASAKDGLLTITLPKLDRTRQTKLRVKAG